VDSLELICLSACLPVCPHFLVVLFTFFLENVATGCGHECGAMRAAGRVQN
jgi:hypothetical protein